jgi:hypothetical protein
MSATLNAGQSVRRKLECMKSVTVTEYAVDEVAHRARDDKPSETDSSLVKTTL